MDGIYVNQKLIYVAAADYKKAPGRAGLPKQGTTINLDGKTLIAWQMLSMNGNLFDHTGANRA